MRPRPPFTLVATLCIVGPLTACGGSTHSPQSCTNETRAEPYTPGSEKTGAAGKLVIRLVDSQPGPPQKGDNTWTLLIKDAAGTPLSGATLDVRPYMPDHGHGTPIKAVPTELVNPAAAGQYQVSPINLFMPGLWQITVTATPKSPSTPDSAMFPFCIEG